MTVIISDEAVNIALNTWLGGIPAWRNDATERLRTEMRAALTAALPFLPVQGAVKKLEWKYVERAVMTYVTSDDRGMLYYINQSFGSDSYYFATVRYSDGTVLYDGDDLPSAKAAAQADYEARVMSTIETVIPVSQPSAARELALEEIIALCKDYAEDSQPDSEYRLACNDIIEALQERRALSSPDHADAGKVEGDGWRPIESAPKDGTIVLLGWNDPDIEEIGAVAGWYESGPADKCWYDQYHEPVTATHWMPLRPFPAAPASEGAE